MNLTHFTEETFPRLGKPGRTSLPRIGFNKAGVIEFSPAAVALLSLTTKDKVALSQDQSGDWYVSKQKKGFELREKVKTDRLLFNHIRLSNEFKSSIGLPQDAKLSCLIAGEATKVNNVDYFGILVPASF